MPALLLCVFRFVRLLMSGHQAVALENAALRLQLAAFQRKRKRPLLTAFDRVFWVALRQLWSGWRSPLIYVQPDTVTRWQRERFRRFWARLSRSHHRRPGRPATAVEIRRLIERMAAANPLWRAPRIHGELKMLGISISERTVSRIIRTIRLPPTQTWKTFLHNHLGQTVSMDFFAVPTIRMRVLFVFIVLEHGRREVLHFNVTEHPTAAWTSQQIREAFADREPTRYAIRDRDGVYGNLVHDCIASLGMEQVLTAPQSPWQNPYAERSDRNDPARVLEPFRHPQRQASEESSRAIFPLLSRLKNSPRTGQAVSVSARGIKRWKDCRNPAARRSPSPL